MAGKRSFIKSKRKRKGSAPRRSLGRRLMRWLLIAVLLVIGVPVLEVGCARYLDPPGTPLMLQRIVESRMRDEPVAPVRYEWRDLDAVPEMFLRCVIVSEDARFFMHDGMDWKEMKIAFAEAKKSGKPPRGASTITMQCARSLFLWQGRSWLRKGLEAYYTVLMELMLSKRRILELYVNVIEMGDGIYGVDAAAREHFGQEVDTLSREQLAALAGVLPFPLGWNPSRPSRKLRARQQKILQREPTHRFPSGW